ncbi:BTB/POZ domain-containing protein [Xylariaceae sp. FL1651]|nr:BTB/POZ domain-containing protein [Xylariaceae sp. FL1651]
MVLRKHELEAKLKDDLELVQSGVLRDENPLDSSEEFNELLETCRRGDLKRTQELISAGVNLNGKDQFDYTPLIIASLCGHYELVQLLLESGALAERDTFQGERCIYNALNDKIRNLLLKYDYSKSTDPLQPWAAHITSLLARKVPKTSDIALMEAAEVFELHKFILSARSPYFQRKLAEAPETATWKLPHSKPIESFRVVLRYLYLGDIPREVADVRSQNTEEEILTGIDKISKQLEIPKLWEAILSGNDRRLARQRHQDEVNRAQQQVENFFQRKVIGHKMIVDTRKVSEVKWPHGNSVFADCLLRADEVGEDVLEEGDHESSVIPIGPGAELRAQNGTSKPRKSILYPAHKAMLIRSPYFETMFSSQFMEAQESEHLHIIKVDCLPEVLEIILKFIYTEQVECPLELALDLLYASDMLFLDKLKNKAAALISALGSGNNNLLIDRTHSTGDQVEIEVEPINVYDVIHAAWDLRVQRLEEFAARYLAYRLEDYIDEEEFAELIQESAARVKNREETDTIELLDDIRYYLGERFRLRFEDAGLDEMLDESGEINASAVEALSSQLQALNGPDELPKELVGSERAAVTSPQDVVAADQSNIDTGVRTLDGELAEDEFASDAINYQVLLQKIDIMLEKLKLDA